MYLYYSTQRPVAPGSFPKPKCNAVIAMENFGQRQFAEEIGRQTWGWVAYQLPLSEEEATSYELMPARDAGKDR